MSNYVVSAVINLRDNFTRVLNNGTSALGRFGDSVNRAEGIFNNRFNRINAGAMKTLGNLKQFGTMTIGAGMTVGAGAYKAFDAYLGLNEQLVRNRALSGLSKQSYAELEEQVKKLGRTTQFTPIEVAQAQKYQHMAGLGKEQILELTPKLLKVSNISGADVGEVSDFVTDSMSAFGLDFKKDSTEYLDVVSSLASRTNTDIMQVGKAFTYIASPAKALNQDYKEMAVLLGILGDNGLKGERAGTSLRGIMTRMAKPTKEMMEQFKKTNTKLYNEDKFGNIKMLSLREIIEGSREELMKLTAEQRNNWLATVAGTEGISAWTAVMNNGVDSTKRVEEAVYNATGSVDKMNDVIREADKTSVDELKSAFEGLKIQIGEAVSPKILTGVKTLTKYINDLSDSGQINSTNIDRVFDKMKTKATEVLGWITGSKALYHALAFGLTGNPYHLIQAGLNAGISGFAIGTNKGKEHGEAYGKLVNEEKKKSLEFGLKRHGDIFGEQRFRTPVDDISDNIYKNKEVDYTGDGRKIIIDQKINNPLQSYIIPDNGLKPIKSEAERKERIQKTKETKESKVEKTKHTEKIIDDKPTKQEINITFTGDIKANSKEDIDRMALLLAQKLRDGVI